jgi:chaperonin GroEL (HSP60 family)
MAVIKRGKKETVAELVKSIDQLVRLLRNQNEDDAIRDLNRAAATLATSDLQSDQFAEALALVVDCFEGEHDLAVYTAPKRNQEEWTEADELGLASSKVLSLARRIR